MEANEFEHLLAALMPPNRLACEVSACTGLRISDVLNLRTAKLAERFSVRELKTGKIKRVRLPRSLLDRLLAQAGRIYVFENRLDYRKPQDTPGGLQRPPPRGKALSGQRYSRFTALCSETLRGQRVPQDRQYRTCQRTAQPRG